MRKTNYRIPFMCLVLVGLMATSWAGQTPSQNPRKNVIVLIPDGCGATHTTLARWYLHWSPELSAEQGKFVAYPEATSLAVDEMNVGCVRNWATNSLVTDSAPAATAFATGYKTADKFIGVLPDASSIPGYTLPAVQDYYRPVPTILEGAKRVGKSVGLVATSNVQHATPAGFSGHVQNRALYNELAEQQVFLDIDVMFGGGWQYLLPTQQGGKRIDGQNLVAVLESRGYQYLTTRDELLSLDAGVTKVWGLFAKDAMSYEFDRPTLAPTEPSLVEMTESAISILSKNPKGFFLMVEGSKVDWASHANDPIGVLSDVLVFDAAVQAALDFARADKNTLVLVFTDHGNGGMTIGNKSTDETYSKMPWASVVQPLSKAFLTGEGIEKLLLAKAADLDGDTIADDITAEDVRSIMAECYGISNLTDDEVVQIQKRIETLINEKLVPPVAPALATYGLNYVVGPMISSRSNIGWTTTGHTGEDLFVYAYGNTQNLGTLENTDLAKLSAKAMGFDLKKLESVLFTPAESAFTALGAKVELTSQQILVTNPKNGLEKLPQLVPNDLVVTKGSLTATMPVGTDMIRIAKTRNNGTIVWTFEMALDGLTVYTAPYKTASTPDGSAPALDKSRVFVPSLSVKIFDLMAKWFR
jgi:alkaline phosphatase